MATMVATESGLGACPDDASDVIIDVGTILRRAREAAGFTIADIASRTRITEQYLRALEASEFATFSAPLYAIGFAKSFARQVGVSEPGIAAAVRDRIAEDLRAPEEEPLPLPSEKGTFLPRLRWHRQDP